MPELLINRARKRIEHFYVALRRLENDVRDNFHPAKLNKQIAQLDQMEREVLKLRINKKLVAEFYDLRSDIEFVRAVLARLREVELVETPKTSDTPPHSIN